MVDKCGLEGWCLNFFHTSLLIFIIQTSGWVSPWTMHTNIASWPSPENTTERSTLISGGSKWKIYNKHKNHRWEWKMENGKMCSKLARFFFSLTENMQNNLTGGRLSNTIVCRANVNAAFMTIDILDGQNVWVQLLFA